MRQRNSTPVAAEKTDLILLISPHFGVVDSWLPILCELKRRRVRHIYCCRNSGAKGVERIDPHDFLATQATTLVDRVIFADSEKQWIESHDLSGLRDIRAKMPKQRTFLNFLNRALPQSPRGLPRECKAVLSDVLLSERRVIRDLQRQFSSSVWFSLPHGLDLRTWKISQKKQGAEAARSKKKIPTPDTGPSEPESENICGLRIGSSGIPGGIPPCQW